MLYSSDRVILESIIKNKAHWHMILIICRYYSITKADKCECVSTKENAIHVCSHAYMEMLLIIPMIGSGIFTDNAFLA